MSLCTGHSTECSEDKEASGPTTCPDRYNLQIASNASTTTQQFLLTSPRLQRMYLPLDCHLLLLLCHLLFLLLSILYYGYLYTFSYNRPSLCSLLSLAWLLLHILRFCSGLIVSTALLSELDTPPSVCPQMPGVYPYHSIYCVLCCA